MYRPMNQKEYQPIRLSFRKVAVATVSLPLFSFLFCIAWSLLFNFTESTSTHCRVWNFLPSISAAIGGYTPQRYVWRIGIGLHAAPRYAVAVMYYHYYSRLLDDRNAWKFSSILCGLHIVENSALLGLTYISSSDNYPIHEKMFVTFVLSSLTYMILSCLLPYALSRIPLTPDKRKVLRLKCCLGITNAVFGIFAVYFFLRHGKFCEPGIYSLFALSEYIIVLSNMAFHMTAYWDFYDEYLIIGNHEKNSRTFLFP